MLFHVLVFDGDAAAFFDLGCEVVVLVHLFLFRFISFSPLSRAFIFPFFCCARTCVRGLEVHRAPMPVLWFR